MEYLTKKIFEGSELDVQSLMSESVNITTGKRLHQPQSDTEPASNHKRHKIMVLDNNLSENDLDNYDEGISLSGS